MKKRANSCVHLLWRFILPGLVIFSLALPGCSQHLRLENLGTVPSLSSLSNLVRVPLTYQGNAYTCGVAALQSILYYYGEELQEEELVEKLEPTPEEGTQYPRMVDFAKSLNFRVEVRTGMALSDLKRLIDEKQPVILLIQAWAEKAVNYSLDWEDGHYVIAVGYDSKNIYFMDPSVLGHYAYLPLEEFINRWHDRYGPVVLHQFGMVIGRGRPAYDPDEVKGIR